MKRLAILGLLLGAGCVYAYWSMIRMPGQSYRGKLEPMTDAQLALSEELSGDVHMLAGTIGPRNVFHPAGLHAAVEFLEHSLAEAGYEVRRQSFAFGGQPCINLDVEITGATIPNEIVVIGAHYDSVDDSPAANDNGSGVAATLALARRFAGSMPARTLRFALFVNEEPPFFQTPDMGSWVYAKACRQRQENIIAMISLETIGCYFDQPNSQHYPLPVFNWLYPTTGDFIAFVGNYSSRTLAKQAIGSFRRHARFPSEGGAVPGWIEGVGWSDHWAFWHEGYPAIMVTDTALFRYPHYHRSTDTPEKLDYDRLARVVEGLAKVVEDLAQ